ncbi:MAG: glycine--tRNA ligase subunit alpha, partial [Coriobacteriia bacterium]|nr:glycine--tRNA ligase subunit alpha [Coriobacteriia bacterium]
AISVTERVSFILRVRTLAKACCEAYVAQVRGELGADVAAETTDTKGGDAS